MSIIPLEDLQQLTQTSSIAQDSVDTSRKVANLISVILSALVTSKG